ncbi:hypothetical protein C8D78_1436 [Arthrobacter oryzae]|uniref:Peptidase S1 domain-containing protein n=2 Tax=Arthrobacter oryzae TaxID=409290 RepID=A0A495EUV7_9MICC|nr:hypothetical protein C8D78_1436 [Arthrobacter oryzae]
MMRAAAALAIAVCGALPAIALTAVPAVAVTVTPAPVPSASPEPVPTATPAGAGGAGSSAPTPAPTAADAAPPALAGSSSSALSSASAAPLLSDAGLAEAVRRDLGMTLAQFNAAGALARRAADAAPSLRALPGYEGIRLDAGKITVEGNSPELRSRVAELNQLDGKNQAGGADFVLAAPASVRSDAALLASSTQQLFEAYVREVGAAGLQAVTYTSGHFVIRTGGTNSAQSAPASGPDARPASAPEAQPATAPGAKPKIAAADFVARYANVALEKGSRIATEEDFFGGQGYVIDGRTLCSAGFGAFSPKGEPLVLTAGHCAADGTAKQAEIEDPAGATAAGGGSSGAVTGALGTFGFSQFGGPGNAKVAADGSNVGTDIAVLRGIRGGLNVQPAVTRWDQPADPGPTSVKIVGTVAPFQGQPVCRSGRTLGWSCGTVDSVGTWVIPGPNSLPPNYDNDLRALSGFDSTTVKSRPGDSGGPWISGNFAVGTHTGAESDGGVQTRAVATTLEDATGRIPGGIQLQLFLNKPTLTAAATETVTAGEPIAGHVGAAPASAVAAKSKVRITVGAQKLEVPVDAAGNWTFRAPLPSGQLAFSAETVNGFSHSEPAYFTATVAPAPLSAPGMTTPTGTTLPALNSIDGTGMPGATVRLSGDVSGSGTVGLDGRWSIKVADQPVSGLVSVTAVLTTPGEADSPSVTSTYTVRPPAPTSSIRQGQHLRQDALPTDISGTGVSGADVRASVDGVSVGSVRAGAGGAAAGAAPQPTISRNIAGDSRWSVPFPARLAVGAHTLTVTQTVDAVVSHPAEVVFIIDPAAVSAGTRAEPPAGQQLGTPAVQPPGAQLPEVQPPGAQPRAARPPAAQPLGDQPLVAGPLRASAPPAPVPSSPVSPSDVSVTVEGAATGGTSSGNVGQLAGFGGLLPVAGLAAGVLLLGAAAVAFGRRRRMH